MGDQGSLPKDPFVKGFFIVFEGLDGSGKTTQAQRLFRHLEQQSYEVLLLKEPGGTPLGERIRALLLDAQHSLEPLTELLCYEASRHELTHRVLRPALERGAIVICQRYSHSSLAYQGYGRGLPLEWIETLNKWATEGLKPDVVFFLDIPAEEGLKRLKGKTLDRIERQGLAFLQRVERGYRALSETAPEIIRVDGRQDPEKVFEDVLRALYKRKGDPNGIHRH